jgi:hypothetical protein
MNRMKKRTVLAINAGVWLAALTSATAVAFAATRSASVSADAPSLSLETSIECAPASPFVSVLEPTIYMPDDVIVGARPRAEGP